MKTRREFIRFTLGGLACLGAAVMAPRSLMAIPDEEALLKKNNPWMTTGYSRTWPEPDNTGFTITTTKATTMYDNDGNITWQKVQPNARWSTNNAR